MRPTNLMVLLPMLVLAIACKSAESNPPIDTSAPRRLRMDSSNKSEIEARKKQLTKEQFHVTQECGTEPPFHNTY